jgi:hypothetical protein
LTRERERERERKEQRAMNREPAGQRQGAGPPLTHSKLTVRNAQLA